MPLSADDLRNRIREIEHDLVSQPLRISAYHDLPFAIFRYDPLAEYLLRKEAVLLATRLQENHGRRATFISIGEIMWRAIRDTEGVAAIVSEEQELGFDRAQRTVSTILSDPEFAPLPWALLERLRSLDPDKDIAFLVRAAALAPAIYHVSKLLDELQGRTAVPAILFYPGSVSAESNTGLRFMSMPNREAYGNYRVKIY
jgi:hypothetical protein